MLASLYFLHREQQYHSSICAGARADVHMYCSHILQTDYLNGFTMLFDLNVLFNKLSIFQVRIMINQYVSR